jgi:hypothetical protein
MGVYWLLWAMGYRIRDTQRVHMYVHVHVHITISPFEFHLARPHGQQPAASSQQTASSRGRDSRGTGLRGLRWSS